jgi:hypothetical protein
MRFACMITVSFALSTACSGDGGEDGGEAGSDGSSGSSTSTSTSTSTSSDSGGSTGETGTSATGEGAADSSTGPVYECFDYDEASCTGDCAPIYAQPYMQVGDTWCLGESLFVGCRDASLGCAEVETVGCNRDGFTYLVPDACLPDFWNECMAPVPDAAPC